MHINGRHYHTIWPDPENHGIIHCIDQRKLPFEFLVEQFTTPEQVCVAIRDMHLRGAPLIGVAASFGMYLSAKESRNKKDLVRILLRTAERLVDTRPTAINLKHAVDRQLMLMRKTEDPGELVGAMFLEACRLREEELENSRLIGRHGLPLIRKISELKGGEAVNILTHCNAGWLACIDYGTATAPLYQAYDEGIKLHVWVDETRPRNQGARLTAWELGRHGVSNTIIADNTGGHLMQKGLVDLVLVGCDRASPEGDVANKIGTYLKALAAFDNGIPFYAALPSSTIDWALGGGPECIPVEERDPEEIHFMEGLLDHKIRKFRITPENSTALNYGFDITPARLVTGLITERGVCPATREGLKSLFPENIHN